VNVAARMLSLTKVYHTKFITTSKCISQLSQPSTSGSSATLPNPFFTAGSPPREQQPSPPPPKNPGAYKFYNQRMLDTVRVPGKDEAIAIHEIFDNESQVAQIKVIYEAGLAHYQGRRFEEASKQFEEALKVYPGDAPSQMLLDKCTKYLREGVPNDWDGVTVVSVK
jgi:TolA-binding protein